MEHTLLILLTGLAFLLAFVNGHHDGFNVIANSVLSRSMGTHRALLLACAATFLAPLFFGYPVAVVIGHRIINTLTIGEGGGVYVMLLVLSGLISAIVWSLLTWWVGMPHSTSHALVGGLVGGGIAAFGIPVFHVPVLVFRVLLFLVLSPLAGLVLSYLAVTLLPDSKAETREGYQDRCTRMQWVGLIILSAGHGSNNAPKVMGLIALALAATDSLPSFQIPLWTALCCAFFLALGVAAGGWQPLRSLGDRTSRITPSKALHAQLHGGLILFLATMIGTPLSTSQIVKSTIIGVSAGYRRWPALHLLYKDVLTSWFLTIPACAVLSAAIYWIAGGALGVGMGSFEAFMQRLGQ